jgi:hypothetical protein
LSSWGNFDQFINLRTCFDRVEELTPIGTIQKREF